MFTDYEEALGHIFVSRDKWGLLPDMSPINFVSLVFFESRRSALLTHT